MKFKIVKKYSLASLGVGWEECYLDFTPFTIAEITSGDIIGLSQIDTSDSKSVVQGTKDVLELLKKHFIGGKALGDSGVVEVKDTDLEDFPAEVLGGILGFLSGKSAE